MAYGKNPKTTWMACGFPMEKMTQLVGLWVSYGKTHDPTGWFMGWAWQNHNPPGWVMVFLWKNHDTTGGN